MPSLQIRDLPDPLHEALQARARAHKRSLAQQALHDLEEITGGDRLQRRNAALARLQDHWRGVPSPTWNTTPEELIRADRNR